MLTARGMPIAAYVWPIIAMKGEIYRSACGPRPKKRNKKKLLMFKAMSEPGFENVLLV